MGKDVIESILFREVLGCREGRENFDIPAGAKEKPLDRWGKQPESFLKTIAMRLPNLRSFSADIERTFVILGLIQAERRMNFWMASLTDLARAKISMIESRKDQELHDSIHPEDSERPNTACWSAPHGFRDICWEDMLHWTAKLVLHVYCKFSFLIYGGAISFMRDIRRGGTDIGRFTL